MIEVISSRGVISLTSQKAAVDDAPHVVWPQRLRQIARQQKSGPKSGPDYLRCGQLARRLGPDRWPSSDLARPAFPSGADIRAGLQHVCLGPRSCENSKIRSAARMIFLSSIQN